MLNDLNIIAKDTNSFLKNYLRKQKYSGGFMLEKCCHDIDFYSMITKSRPIKVASFGGRNSFIPENNSFPLWITPQTSQMSASYSSETSENLYISFIVFNFLFFRNSLI